MSKYDTWWNSLPENTKTYLKKQPIWHDRDLYRVAMIGASVGFVLGVVVGFQWAWEPVVTTVRYMVG
jgi:hypothetical protein